MTAPNDLLNAAEFPAAGNTIKLEPTPEAPVPSAAIGPGAVVKNYELIRNLGAGGMGTVFLARDMRLGRLVAIKFLLDRTGTALKRFLVEARTTAQCRHENIVVVYDVDEIYGRPYMVLEYVEGRTLREAITVGSGNPAAIAIELMLPVARALACAHEMGIVHRDLKPENIFLSNAGQIKVLDFGIAKRMTSEEVKTLQDSGTFRVPRMSMLGLTEDGAFFGTIQYMSPEQWLEEPLDGRSDIWAAGLILFELAIGTHPLAPLTPNELMTVSDLDVPMPSARDKLPQASRLAEVIDRCLKKRREDRYASAAELAEALEALGSREPISMRSDGQSPFAGLAAFQEMDADRFFGRDDDIAAVVGKLRQQPLVAIVGASGAGKSSFVRAGVIPALKRAGRELEVFVVRPGRQPIAALADVLAFLVDTGGGDEESNLPSIAETLRTQPGYLGAKLRARCRKRGPEHRILLLVDQLEELYTQGIAPDERAAFCACLEGVADDASSPLRMILTIRADFLDRLSEERRFLATMTRGLFFLPPMSTLGLRDALEKPLVSVGYRFEDEDLCNQMLDGLAGTRSPLPLLQFTATKLWDTRDRERQLLTRAAYETLGGVAGALSTHADAIVAQLSLSEQRMARSIVLRLVTAERTRAVVRWDELEALTDNVTAVEHVVHLLAEARLVSIESSVDREGKTVELTHESLIERWSKLKQWLDENEKDVVFLGQLRNAAAQWGKNGQAEGFLWRDRAAIEAGQWLERRKGDVGPEASFGIGTRELAYLEAVVRLSERAKRRRRQLIGALFVGISAVAVVIGLLAFQAQENAKAAEEQADIANKQAIIAGEQSEQRKAEARQARNAIRVMAARELLDKDPTKSLALLREIEPGSIPHKWAPLAFWAKGAAVAETVYRHDGVLAALSWSADRKRIVSNAGTTIRVWSADGMGTPLTLEGHAGAIWSVNFSADGRRIVSASADKTVRIWNANGTGQPQILRAHDDQVCFAAFDPTGERVASASYDRTVRIWNTKGSETPRLLKGHTDTVRAVAWSPDGTRIASASWDKTVRIWDANGTEPPLVLNGHEGEVFDVAWSPDGKQIASASADRTIRLWNADDTTAKPIVLHGHEQDVRSIAWSSDGKRIVSGANDRTVRIWDADGLRTPLILRGHEDLVFATAFSPDGERVWTASWDRTMRSWRIAGNGKPIVLSGHDNGVYGIAFGPDGRIVSASFDKTVRVWKADGTGQPLVLRGHEGYVFSARFSPDGKRIVSGSEDKTARIWTLGEKTEPLVLRHDALVYSAVFSPDGQRVVTASEDNTVRVWNADGNGSPVVFRDHENLAFMAAFSPDGQRIASASMDKTVRVRNADGTDEPLVFRGHDGGVFGVDFSPDGKRIVSGSADKTVRIWNADGTGTPIVFEGHENTIATVAFSPDGRQILSGSNDGTARIWDLEGKKDPFVLRTASGSANGAAWSPDGTFIVTAEDNTPTVYRDLQPLQGSDDPRLWSATAYCMPLDVRQRLLDFTTDQLRTDLLECQKHTAKVFGGALRPN